MTTHLSLVNLNQIESRTVVLQTGAYGEHQCKSVKAGDREYEVDTLYFDVHLGPGAGTELVIKARRYSNQTTPAFPWHGETVPRAY